MAENRNGGELNRHLPEHIAGGLPSTDAIQLTLAVLPCLTDGEPVPWSRFEALASRYGSPRAVFDESPPCQEVDDRGDVVGLMGLSLRETEHQFVVGGQTLSTWCAFDGLVLPVALRRTAYLSSTDPISGAPVHLRVAPDAVQRVDPAAAALSVADPQRQEARTAASGGPTSFCPISHFFAAVDTAARWQAEHQGVTIVSVEDGFHLGQALVDEVLSHA